MQGTDIERGIVSLSRHEAIIFPTETVYGLGCDAMSDRAVQYLLDLSFRPQEKGITTLCNSIDMIEDYGIIRFPTERQVMKKFMPGPLTIILNSRQVLSPLVEQANDTIGVRIPDHPIALDLIARYGKGLATKSANITGGTPPISPDRVDPYFIEHKITIIDGGECSVRLPSTIVRFDSEYEFRILREGSISKEDIMKVMYGV